MVEEREPAGGLHKGGAMRSEDAAGNTLPMPSDGERALQTPRWAEHGAEDCGWNRAYPAGGDKTRILLEGGNARTAARPRGTPSIAGSYCNTGHDGKKAKEWMR
jgi:hypothetical protein